MSAAWFMYPIDFESSRAFECDDLDPEQCSFYKETWHFWYVSDLVFGLSTIAFFMSAIGIFVAVYIGSYTLQIDAVRRNPTVQRLLALFRYASYRGFHIRLLKWYSAPIGLLLLALIGAVFFFCMDLIPQPYYWSDEIFGNSPPLGTRSGWMALACMPFVFATSSKANWLTLFTGVSHERLQVFHRWIAYAFFLLALMHAFPFVVYHTMFGDIVSQVTVTAVFEYWTGIAALILQAWLTFASHSTIRGLGYEFFKAMHIATMILFTIIFFWHCDGTLTSWDYFVATAAIYVPCLAYSFIRTFFEHGLGLNAKIMAEHNGDLRIEVPGDFIWTPGQHCFLRFPKLGVRAAITSHPFTICSTQADSALVFYVQPRGGLTRKLYELVRNSSIGETTTKVLVDGPYGGINISRFDTSDRLVIIAGGSGAGWCLPLVARFAEAALKADSSGLRTSSNTSLDSPGKDPRASQDRKRSMRIILSAKDVETLKWLAETLQQLLAQYAGRYGSQKLDINLHLTRDMEEKLESPLEAMAMLDTVSAKEQRHSSIREGKSNPMDSQSIIDKTLSSGRPRLPVLLHEEAIKASERQSTIGVFVCGPLSMQNDVRNAVARENLAIVRGTRSGPVYLHQEHFSWA